MTLTALNHARDRWINVDIAVCVFAAKYTARRVRCRSLRRLELVAGRCISEIRHVFSTLRVLDSFRRDPTTSLFSLHWRIHSAMGALRRPILVH